METDLQTMAQAKGATQTQKKNNNETVATKLYKTLLYSGLYATYILWGEHNLPKLCHSLRRPGGQGTLWGEA